ncbi:MAG: transposase [Bernardetiaceae bacterium]|nr:transposase [Bernardetiaceae bacterium]
MSAISAITPCGELFFAIKQNSYQEEDVIQFLTDLHAFLGQKMLIICDRASIHKSKKLKAFIAEKESYKDIFYTCHLPPYSPELNPDELVWAELKNNKLKSHINYSLQDLRIYLENALKE